MTSKLSNAGICIISGAAMGVDSIAHQGAGTNNTIAVVANGLDIRYPSVNKNLIIDIEKNGLMLSAYKEREKAKNYTFVLRNEIVVALSEFLIVTEADIDSGSLTSVNYALKMGKPVYTIPHRINESLGTQELIKKGLVKVIYDIDEFIYSICGTKNESIKDEVLLFCKNNPSYESAIEKFADRIFEYELEGKIKIENGKIVVI